MSRFKPYRPEQAYLLPPSVKDVLGAGHVCFFVQPVIGQLDLSRFEQQYSAEGGELYAVPLMLSVWLYAYATGLTSARELERRIREDLPKCSGNAGRRRKSCWPMPATTRTPTCVNWKRRKSTLIFRTRIWRPRSIAAGGCEDRRGREK